MYTQVYNTTSLVQSPFMYIQVYNTTSQSSTISLHVHTGIQYNQSSTISLHVHTGIQYSQSVQYNLPLYKIRYTIQPVSAVQSPFMYIQVYNTASQSSTISLYVHTSKQYTQSVQYNLPSCTYRYTIQPVSAVQSTFMYIQVYNTIIQSSTISFYVHTGIQYTQSVQYNLPSRTYRYTIQPVSAVQSPFMHTQVNNTTSQSSTISLHVHTGIQYTQSVQYKQVNNTTTDSTVQIQG